MLPRSGARRRASPTTRSPPYDALEANDSAGKVLGEPTLAAT